MLGTVFAKYEDVPPGDNPGGGEGRRTLEYILVAGTEQHRKDSMDFVLKDWRVTVEPETGDS